MKFFQIVLTLVFLLAAGLPAFAQSAQPMVTVADIVVDKTAENAVIAREQAIAEGRRAAFRQLAERYLSPDRLQSFTLPDDTTINQMVQDFEITSEQIGNNRYLATFAYRFRADSLSLYFGTPIAGEVPVLETPKAALPQGQLKQTLVLPFIDRSGRPELWVDPNPWLTAWQAASLQDAQGRYRLPLGDATDMAAGPVTEVWSGNTVALEKLRQFYGAEDVLLTIAKQAGRELRIDLYELHEGSPVLQKTLLVHGVGAYARAVEEVVAWRDNALPAAPDVGTSFTAEVTAYFSRPAEWMEIQRRLRAIKPRPSVNIGALSRSTVRFVLKFEGSEGDLRQALTSQNIVLERSAEQSNYSFQQQSGQQTPYQLRLANAPEASR